MAGAKKQSGAKNGDQDTESIRRRLDTLDGKLTEARGLGAPPVEAQARGRAMGQALKLSVELVGGVVVGGLVGWALDQLFGTKPVLMLVFLVLGAASGIMNVMRTAKAMQDEPMPGHHLRVPDGRDVAAENDKDKGT
jgi:ATP synthase protein I